MDGLQSIVSGPGARIYTTTTAVDRPNQTTTVTALDNRIELPSLAVYKGNRTLVESREAFQYGTSNKTVYDYDGNGRLWKVTNALNQTTIYSYHPQNTLGAGQISSIQLPDNALINRTYSSLGMLETESGTGTYWKKFTYNAFGEMTGMATKRAGTEVWTNWQRDAGTGLIAKKSYGNTSAIFQNNSSVVSYAYDAVGRLATRTWARGITTTYGYTKANEMNSVNYSDNTPDVTGMVYDRGGRLTGVSDSSGTRTITYSDYDQRANETYSEGGLGGYAVSRTYGTSTNTRNLRQTLSASGPGGFSYPTVAYGYVTGGRLDDITQGSYWYPFVRQAGHTVVETTVSHVLGTNRLLTRSAPRDEIGRLRHVGNQLTQPATLVSATGSANHPLQYDAAGRLEEISREDGSKWSYDYNTRGEVESGVKKFSDNTFIPGHQFTYTYDGIGNRLTAARGGNQNGQALSAISYTANDLNQYTSLTTPGEQWITGEASTSANVVVNDGPAWRHGMFFGREIELGNTTGPAVDTVTVKANMAPSNGDMVQKVETGKLLVPPASVTASYDADGNLTGDEVWYYVWDGENRLKRQISKEAVPEAERRFINFSYDYEGRCISRRIYGWDSGLNDWSSAPLSYQRCLYDGWNLIATTDEVGPTRRFVWGPDLSGTLEGAGGVGGLLSMWESQSGKTCWYAYDHNGNVTALVDSSNQQIVANYEYGPFGEPLRASGSMAKVNPFRFSTKYTENESGLVLYPFRLYIPSLGRWATRDPLGDEAFFQQYTENKNWMEVGELYEESLRPPYLFCYNTPINGFDPFGDKATVNMAATPPIPGQPGHITLFVDIKLFWECSPTKNGRSVLSLDRQKALTQGAQRRWTFISTKRQGLFRAVMSYEVNATITARYADNGDRKESPYSENIIKILDEGGRSSVVTQGPRGFGPTTMYFKRPYEALTFEHEIGHVIGHRDRYTDNAAGTRATTMSGWSNNLMGDKSPNVDWRNVEEIMSVRGLRSPY